MVLTLSGVTFCACVDGLVFSGAINGAFTLTLSAPGVWTLIVPDAITVVEYAGSVCTGTPISTTNLDLNLSFACGGGANIDVRVVSADFFNAADSTYPIIGTVYNNLNTTCPTGGLDNPGAIGGTATISL